MFLKSELRNYIVLHIVFFLAFFMGSFPALVQEAAIQFLLRLLGYTVFVLLIEIVVLTVLHRVTALRKYSFLLFGVFTGINFCSLYLMYLEVFLERGDLAQVLIILFAMAFFSFIYWVPVKEPRAFAIILGVAFLQLLLNSVPVAFAALPIDRSDRGGGAYPEVINRWKSIQFSNAPNVHLIGFDALIPESLARKYFELPKVPYQTLLSDQGALIPKNSFTVAVASHAAFNALIKLDDLRLGGDEYFNGQILGPLFAAFKANGYGIATGYAVSSYFGAKGPFIDEYNFNEDSIVHQSMICIAAPRRVLGGFARRHFAFCKLGRKLERESDWFLHYRKWTNQIVQKVGSKNASGRPWLTLHYMPIPIGHTPSDFNREDRQAVEDYKTWYAEKSLVAAEVMKDIVDKVVAEDPNSIVFVFGDHGTYFSRGVERKENPEFFVQDRHGVFAALLKTEHECSTPSLKDYNPKFHTLGRIMASVIRCLSKNPEEVDQAVHFESFEAFENFLYE